MIKSSFTAKILKADEGMYLTQTDDNIPLSERIIEKEIALQEGDFAINYKEITDEEAKELLKQKFDNNKKVEEDGKE